MAIEKVLGMDLFHRNQFGFRKGKSTIDAISQVCKFADSCRKKGIVCDIMCIDVKNAFNSLRWEVILKEAKSRSLPSNLTRVLANYLKDRFVVLDNPSGLIVKQIFAGVPQGSVVGPLLWNLIYDDLLARFNNRVNLRAIAFADDLAILVGLRKKESVEVNLNLHMKTILNWCENSGLQIAKEKTEIILLTRMTVQWNFNITPTVEVLNTRETVKYLGVVLDSARKYRDHIAAVCNKADAIVGAIRGCRM